MSKELFTVAMKEINEAKIGSLTLTHNVYQNDITHIEMLKGSTRLARGRISGIQAGKCWHFYFDVNDLISFTTWNDIEGEKDESAED